MKDPRTRVEELVYIVKDRMGTNEPGLDTDDFVEIADYWVERYFESKGYTYYSMAQRAKPAKTKLAERGWFLRWRVPSILDSKRRPPMPKTNPLEHDPVAKVVRRGYIDRVLVKTPQELIEEARKEAKTGGPDVTNKLANPRELHEHLVKIAPALHTRYRFSEEDVYWEPPAPKTGDSDVDEDEYFEDFWAGRDPQEIRRSGYVRTEYWESMKTGEALWAFPAFRSGRRASDRGVVWNVWEKVKILEKVAEDLDEPFIHKFDGYEDEQVREALEELSWIYF
jgi:hypothetical protein